MFTWTHIAERRFDWRAFRLQNKILLLLFFTFNHQNVNSKCNNDAQMWKHLYESAFWKTPVYLQNISEGQSEGQPHTAFFSVFNTGWNSL